jgi:NADH-quinone oxidoreductase subunit E
MPIFRTRNEPVPKSLRVTSRGKGTIVMPPSTTSSSPTVASVAEEVASDIATVDAIIDEHQAERTELIAILLDTQERIRYLPVHALKHISRRMEIPLTEIYGIATFYKIFRLSPPGRHQITVCMGTACHVRGAAQVLKEFERRLGICTGGVTPDREYGLDRVNCVGACAIGPVVIIDDEYHGELTTMKVPVMLRRMEKARREVGS